jgi:hypothetical protein
MWAGGRRAGLDRRLVGYDWTMSETTPDNEAGTTQDTPDQGLIGDDQLPDDLRPDENPLAQAPDADPDGDQAGGAPAAPGGASGGADAGQPG